MFEDVNAASVYEIIGHSPKFVSPFSEPYGYYIWIQNPETGNADHEAILDLYFCRLRYAAQNIDLLIRQAAPAIQANLSLSDDLWQNLMVESFVLASDDKEIACCLSNPEFMFGHYIECRWDFNWNLISVYYC